MFMIVNEKQNNENIELKSTVDKIAILSSVKTTFLKLAFRQKIYLL